MDKIEEEFKQLLNPDKERTILTNTLRASDLPGSRERKPITTEDLLIERGKTHGDYALHARITQEIKRIYRDGSSHDKFTDAQRESLDMIAHKIGRIIAGDPDFRDHWDDIAGYAKLVADRCSK
mgnify:CR=1 FL=1